ncbi:MAG: hypothetical protein PHW87_13310, partial [Methanothrix sp.]|nr:hypothetical protein [Methanothrix sp.]
DEGERKNELCWEKHLTEFCCAPSRPGLRRCRQGGLDCLASALAQEARSGQDHGLTRRREAAKFR